MAIYDGKRLVHRNHITESEDIAKQDDQIVDSIVRNLLQGEWDTISAMEADLSFVEEAKADQVVIDALVHVLEEEYEHHQNKISNAISVIADHSKELEKVSEQIEIVKQKINAGTANEIKEFMEFLDRSKTIK